MAYASKAHQQFLALIKSGNVKGFKALKEAAHTSLAAPIPTQKERAQEVMATMDFLPVPKGMCITKNGMIDSFATILKFD